MKPLPFAIHDPSGAIVMRALPGVSRKRLRRSFADQMTIKWHSLWLQGFRLKTIDRSK